MNTVLIGAVLTGGYAAAGLDQAAQDALAHPNNLTGRAGNAVALAASPVRNAIGDSVPGTWSNDLTRIFFTIPVGTVIPEELAFRGAMLSLLRDRYGPLRAVTVSSVLFALWHVLPALGGGAANKAPDRSLGVSPVALAIGVALTLIVTFLAGLLFCALRLRWCD